MSMATTQDIIGAHLLQLWRADSLIDLVIVHSGDVLSQAHQVVVSAFSGALLQRLLAAPVMLTDTRQQFKVLQMDDIEAENIAVLVTYMYTNHVDLAALPRHRIQRLGDDARTLHMTHLMDMIAKYQEESQSTLSTAHLICYQAESKNSSVAECDDSLATQHAAQSQFSALSPVPRQNSPTLDFNLESYVTPDKPHGMDNDSHELSKDTPQSSREVTHDIATVPRLSLGKSHDDDETSRDYVGVSRDNVLDLPLSESEWSALDAEAVPSAETRPDAHQHNQHTHQRETATGGSDRSDTNIEHLDDTNQFKIACDFREKTVTDISVEGNKLTCKPKQLRIYVKKLSESSLEDHLSKRVLRKRRKASEQEEDGTVKIYVPTKHQRKKARVEEAGPGEAAGARLLQTAGADDLTDVKTEEDGSADDLRESSPNLEYGGVKEITQGSDVIRLRVRRSVSKSKAAMKETVDTVDIKKEYKKDTVAAKEKFTDKQLEAYIQNDGLYRCPECLILEDLESLKAHIRECHPGKEFRCGWCGKQFRARQKYNEHERVHTGERPFRCEQCSVAFKAKKHLDKHLRIHKRSAKLPCSYEDCRATFAEQLHLDRHIRTVHLKIKPYKCDEEGCTYAASDQAGLRSHKNTHLPVSEKPRELCSVCGVEVLGGKANLNIHMIQHSDQTYACPVCDYSTKYKSYMQSHMMRRHGVDAEGRAVEKTLQCPHCPFTCFFRHEFNFHLKKHAPDKPFKCKLCDYTATCASVLKYHFRSHTDTRPYKCRTCDKGFSRPGQLAKHTRMHSGEKPWTCSECGRGFAERRYLEKHVTNIHRGLKPFRCPVCEYACVKKDRMKTHILANHGAEHLPLDMQTKKKTVVKIASLETSSKADAIEQPKSSPDEMFESIESVKSINKAETFDGELADDESERVDAERQFANNSLELIENPGDMMGNPLELQIFIIKQ